MVHTWRGGERPASVQLTPLYSPIEQPTLAVQVLVSISSLSAMLFLSLMTWHALRKRHPRRPGPIADAVPVLEVVGSIPEDAAWSEGGHEEESQPMLGPADAPQPASRATVSGVRVTREAVGDDH